MFDLIYPRLVRARMNPFRRAKAIIRWRTNTRLAETGHFSFVSALTRVEKSRLREFLSELYDDDEFFAELEKRYRKYLGEPLHPAYFEYAESYGSVFFQAVTMYLLIRAARPAIVVETGGASGATAAFSLLALKYNAHGRLVTLDLLPTHVDLPKDRAEHELVATEWWKPEMTSCFLVPDFLRPNHELRLGDAKQTLPRILSELGEIDLFRHDSDHRYDHMTFEFETAFAALKPGGILVSDDIANHSAWRDFCARHRLCAAQSNKHLAGARKERSDTP